MIQKSLISKNCNTMLKIRELDISYHAPLKSAYQSCFQTRNFRWWSITGQNDLSSSFIKCVERVKELLLSCFLALQKLHIVDEQ